MKGIQLFIVHNEFEKKIVDPNHNLPCCTVTTAGTTLILALTAGIASTISGWRILRGTSLIWECDNWKQTEYWNYKEKQSIWLYIFLKVKQINFFHTKSLLLKILLDNFWIFIFEEKIYIKTNQICGSIFKKKELEL